MNDRPDLGVAIGIAEHAVRTQGTINAIHKMLDRWDSMRSGNGEPTASDADFLRDIARMLKAMTRKQALETLAELVARFEHVCKDEADHMDPADAKRIKKARAALAALGDRWE